MKKKKKCVRGQSNPRSKIKGLRPQEDEETRDYKGKNKEKTKAKKENEECERPVQSKEQNNGTRTKRRRRRRTINGKKNEDEKEGDVSEEQPNLRSGIKGLVHINKGKRDRIRSRRRKV